MLVMATVLLSACGNTAQTESVQNTTVSTEETATEINTEENTEAEIPSLKEIYKDDFLIGTIYAETSLTEQDVTLMNQQCNVITPENIMKPENMQPTEGTFNYANSDQMMKFAQDNNLIVVGHTLAWHQQSGDFLGQNVTREEAIEQLRSHITNIVGQYKGQILSWDVVNEAFADNMKLPEDGDWTKCLKDTPWLNSIGSDYLEMAFQFAREADPDVELYYNDYNLNNKDKIDAVCAMVKDFKERGIPIDGVGMQGHYSSGMKVGGVGYALEALKGLDVKVSITELDITGPENSDEAMTEEEAIKQAVTYAQLFKTFKEYSDIIERVTFWGTIDSQSWRSATHPCIFDSKYQPKEAFYAIADPAAYLESKGIKDEQVKLKEAKAMYGTPDISVSDDPAWDASEVYQINNQILAWEGATAEFKILWDEKNLYVHYDVTDEVLNKDSENAYEQDSIEAFVDQNNGKTDFYEDDDGQYRVNYEGTMTFDTAPIQEAKANTFEREGGYIVTIAIPWTLEVSEGSVIGFDAQVNDANDQGVRQSIAKFADLTDNTWSALDSIANLTLSK